MLVDIRPPPGSALLHYPGAFDLEMEFQLREKNVATLEEMQNNAVNGEAHLLIRRARLKEEEMKNVDPEKTTPSDEKLDILVSAVEEMVRKMTAKDENGVHEQVADPKHFVSYLSSHKDYFVDHIGEERPVDMTCMLDDVFYTDVFPQFDQYDDDYYAPQTEANLADKSAASLRDEEVRLQQLEYSDQPRHISYGNDEESATNFEVSEGSLPLCFDSCQFTRDNFHAIRHQLSTNLDLDPLEGDENFVPDFFYSKFQPPNAINSQVVHEDIEVGLYDQMIQEDSLPLCFESFQFLRGKLRSKSSNEKLVGNQQSLSFNVEYETDGEIF